VRYENPKTNHKVDVPSLVDKTTGIQTLETTDINPRNSG
jgi:hypothetical protein